MRTFHPPAPSVSPCPVCGRPPSAAARIGSDPPAESGGRTVCRDHYLCRCGPCRVGYRAGATRQLPPAAARAVRLPA